MKQKNTIVLMGRFDSKGKEYAYVRDKILQGDFNVITVDTGSRGVPRFKPDISREEVARAAGLDIQDVVNRSDESKEIEVMMEGGSIIARSLYDSGKLDGIMCLGGSRGTAIGTAAMRALPFGIPKVMVSTIASGDMRPYVGTRDIMILHSVTDIAGLNRMTKKLLAYAAGAIMGAVTANAEPEDSGKSVVAMSAMGGINRAAFKAQEVLEERRFEVVAFHAVGTGGRAMEESIGQGLINGVLDLVTHELTDHIFGGYYDAGQERLETAGINGIPQVVIPGCLDFIAYSPPETIPENMGEREFFLHTPEVAIVRANKDEMASIGRTLAEKLNKATGPAAVVIPMKGFSPGNRQGRALYDPEADTAFLEALKQDLKPDVKIVELDMHINEEAFAEQVVDQLCMMMESRE
ncbi:Tm-1-like ATP-binding domain-containing protein [Chloroflexota bacterium]